MTGSYGHSGISGEIDKDNSGNVIQMGISGSFRNLKIQLSQDVTTMAPDTFTVHLQQNILHKNQPERVYEVTYFPRYFYIGTGVFSYDNLGSYPMGMWNITVDKTRLGVHTITNDSIYLNMGASAIYTIPW